MNQNLSTRFFKKIAKKYRQAQRLKGESLKIQSNFESAAILSALVDRLM